MTRWSSLLDGRVEGALGGEGAEVQLVEHRSRELAAGPVLVGPLERGRVERPRTLVHAVGLPTRPAGRAAPARSRRAGSRSRPRPPAPARPATTSRRHRGSSRRPRRRPTAGPASGSGAQTSKRPRLIGAPRSRPGARRGSRRRECGPSGSRSTVSPQPPFASSPSGRRVTTVIAPPRSKASTWSAAGPSADHGVVRREQLGSVASQPQRLGGERLLRVGAVDRGTAAAASKSTGRRLSGSTRLRSPSSVPW